MSKLRVEWIGVLVAVIAVLAVGACGGSGGSAPIPTPGPAALSASPYNWLYWSGNVAGPNATTHWGTVTPDGTSVLTSPGAMANFDGAVLAQPLTGLSYAIDGGNELTVFGGGSALLGGLSADGSVGAASLITSDSPSLIFLGRKGAGFSQASLSGDYHFCAFFRNGGSDSELSWWGGTATFDGAGTCTGLAFGINNGGTVTGPGAPAAWGTYTVAADGAMTWLSGIGGPWEGGLFAGGELAVLTGSTQNGVNFQFLVFLIRKGVGLSDATLGGSYRLVALQRLPIGPTRYQTLTTSVASAGTGAITSDDILFVNGDSRIIAVPGGLAFTYAVAADGTLTLDGGEYQGGISQSGRFAVVAGSTINGNPPGVWFFLR